MLFAACFHSHPQCLDHQAPLKIIDFSRNLAGFKGPREGKRLSPLQNLPPLKPRPPCLTFHLANSQNPLSNSIWTGNEVAPDVATTNAVVSSGQPPSRQKTHLWKGCFDDASSCVFFPQRNRQLLQKKKSPLEVPASHQAN